MGRGKHLILIDTIVLQFAETQDEKNNKQRKTQFVLMLSLSGASSEDMLIVFTTDGHWFYREILSEKNCD